MTLSDLHHATPDTAACPVCEQRAPMDPESAARIAPLRLIAGVVRAASAVAATALAACLGPDPIDLQPRVLQHA